MLITEGPGDIAMFEAIVSYHMGGATFEQLGIVPHALNGSPKKKDQRLLELLGALRRFPNFFLFVFDNEGTAPRWASRLEQFEPKHAPFSGASLLEPRTRAGSGPGAELRQAQVGSKRGVGVVALDLAEAQGYTPSKVRLDADLGRYAAENPALEGRTRRVLIVAEHLYRLTVASRMMRGRLRERERERQG